MVAIFDFLAAANLSRTAFRSMNWTIRPHTDESKVNALAHELNVEKFIARLLIQRGVDTFDKARKFFRPSLEHLHDPFLMKDMRVGVERLKQAMFDQEKIMVYGDYDVDGTTAVALVYGTLKEMGQDVEFYIPDRYAEGYGVSEKGVREASKLGCSLMITLDCGITALDQVELARELNMDVIICDHHKPGKQLPQAVAVLDPQRDDCEYPFKHLSGCGVGFKLLQGLLRDQGMSEEMIFEHLDLLICRPWMK